MTQARGEAAQPIGSAVLVHGGWGHPADWTWVRRLLEVAGVEVTTPDLPTHRSTTATFGEDAEEVRHAIRASWPPVVTVGWSYGGGVANVAADGEAAVTHLVFVGSVPAPGAGELTDTSWVDTDPHILVGDDGAFVLDNRWWFEGEAQRLFSGEVLEHLRQHPRRQASRSTATAPPAGGGWRTIPTTVLVGRQDQLISESDRRWMDANLSDVRHLDSDHFILFHQPGAIAQVVLESLQGRRQQSI